ncbi:MAG: bifunctional oligoribonuclease/PAP phosphatase NrnA [Clostridia bacterium]|nr:bifunctional oligoribonuclease/PAP phosphatase NrnA [Clostridia bacterium]
MTIFNVTECAKQLLTKEKIIILIHSNPDGDCIGSGSALAEILINLEKKVRIVCPHALPERLSFICKGLSDDVLCFAKSVEDDFDADFIVSTDVASPELLGKIREAYEDKINLCIDHHIINTMSADGIWRDAKASACGEMILELCDELSRLCERPLLTESVANKLYCAISSDSGSFKYGNTTPKTLLYASRLKSVGADSELISRLLFDTKSPAQFKLTGLVIPRTEFLCDGKLAYCILLDEELSLCGATKEDCDGITQIFREVKGVELSIFAKQHIDSVTGENCVKMSLRSNTTVNCAKICENFGGGGHIKAAGCTIRGVDNEKARELILEKAKEELSSLGLC